jgi:hypothetical protein
MKQTIYMFILLILPSCKSSLSSDTTAMDSDTIAVDTLAIDSLGSKGVFNNEDLPTKDQLEYRIKEIRENFKRINSIASWTSIDVIPLTESTENGEAKLYYENKKLEKFITQHYGEMGKLLTEYYLKDGQISFVFEKSYNYNRPIYYDTVAMKENNDTEAFDLTKSEIEEYRSYFYNNRLIHQIKSPQNTLLLNDDNLLEEQNRIIINFDKYLKLSKNNKMLKH